MSLPRQFSIRVAGIIAVLAVTILVLIRYQENKISADPWYQLKIAHEQDLPLSELRPRLRAAIADLSREQPAQHIQTLLSVWYSMEGINERPAADVLSEHLWDWARYAIDQPTFDLAVVHQIVSTTDFPIAEDQRNEIALRLQRRLALLHAQLTQFDDRIRAEETFDFLRTERFIAEWNRLLDSNSFPVEIRDDYVFQDRLKSWISNLQTYPDLAILQAAIRETPVTEMSHVLAETDTAQRAVFSWWLEWSMKLPVDQQSAIIQNPSFLRAHLICWPEDKGSAWWLAGVLSFALVLCLMLVHWIRRGPSPVDPAAETLERVDPIDLDTQAVTISNPGLETDF